MVSLISQSVQFKYSADWYPMTSFFIANYVRMIVYVVSPRSP